MDEPANDTMDMRETLARAFFSRRHGKAGIEWGEPGWSNARQEALADADVVIEMFGVEEVDVGPAADENAAAIRALQEFLGVICHRHGTQVVTRQDVDDLRTLGVRFTFDRGEDGTAVAQIGPRPVDGAGH